jgi:hypothetical protein
MASELCQHRTNLLWGLCYIQSDHTCSDKNTRLKGFQDYNMWCMLETEEQDA